MRSSGRTTDAATRLSAVTMQALANTMGPFDAQKIFDEIPKDALETKPLKIDWTFYCTKCDGMASMKTCPHGKEDRMMLSGTKTKEDAFGERGSS